MAALDLARTPDDSSRRMMFSLLPRHPSGSVPIYRFVVLGFSLNFEVGVLVRVLSLKAIVGGADHGCFSSFRHEETISRGQVSCQLASGPFITKVAFATPFGLADFWSLNVREPSP